MNPHDPRIRRLRRAGTAALSLLLLAAAACRPAGRSSFDAAVDALFAKGYPQGLETYFCSLGTNPELGFRWAGTTAERAVSDRVATEMKAMGLANVRLEPVPVDVFEFEEASLTVGGRRMTASTIGGVPPTSPEGVTAPVVYVRAGTAADFDAAGDVSGKIALVDIKLGSWWFTLPALEAAGRGVAGIVATSTPEDPRYFSGDDGALGSFDGQYDSGAPPWITISRRDGDRLRSALAAGPVTATLLLREKVTLAGAGGTGFNVVGEIPGARGDGQIVLFAAHQDAHFRAGADDTGGLVNMLTIARAMKESGYRPASTMIFMATTGEEFGYTDAYYEWIIGAWWAATRTHPDWAGRVRAMVNLETMALEGAPLTLRASPELKPWLERLAARSSDLLLYGAEVLTPVSTWNDQWTFTAAGLPSFKMNVQTEAYDRIYHSNIDTADLVDFDHLARIAKFVFRAAGELDDGPLPYSLAARAEEIAAALKTDDPGGAGADAARVSRLRKSLEDFGRAAEAVDAAAPVLTGENADVANAARLEVEKILNSGLTAVSPADDDATVYPYQSVLRDLRGVMAALAALQSKPVDRAAALLALSDVYLTRQGILFSHAAYLKHIARLDPAFERIAWGAQGQLPRPLDVVPQYRQIEAGMAGAAMAALEAVRQALAAELDARLARMAVLLEDAAGAAADALPRGPDKK
jgi:Iap family predicted aminopeptidase